MSFPSTFLWGGATSSVQYEGGFDQGGRGLGHMDFIPCLSEEDRKRLPFTFNHVADVLSAPIPTTTWWEVAYVVCIGTFFGYILTMIGQRTLRPTVVSVYNYVQPIVSVAASLLMGIGILKPTHAVAVILVFSGVWLVTKSKSRKDMEREKEKAVAK